MREIVGRAYTELGRELKEAQDTLRKQGSKDGVFMAWYQSIGFKKDAVSRLINRYELFAICEEPEKQLLEDLPVSLSYEIAAPSAESTEPKRQAKRAVLNGDIRTLKEYRELVAKLEAAESGRKEADWMMKKGGGGNSGHPWWKARNNCHQHTSEDEALERMRQEAVERRQLTLGQQLSRKP